MSILQGKYAARSDCEPLQKQAHHNLKRDLQVDNYNLHVHLILYD